MSLARRTRPLRVALGAIVLASPLALTLGVRSGRLTPVPPLAEGDVWGLVTSMLALLATLLALCVVAHALDTCRSSGRDTR